MPKGIIGFQPGHPPMGGRPKKRITVLKEFILAHPMAYDEMLQILYELATGKSDREAAQYICDRLKGRPHQSIDNRIIAKIDIVTPYQLEQARNEAKLYENTLFMIGEQNAIQELGATKGSEQTSQSEIP